MPKGRQMIIIIIIIILFLAKWQTNYKLQKEKLQTLIIWGIVNGEVEISGGSNWLIFLNSRAANVFYVPCM